ERLAVTERDPAAYVLRRPLVDLLEDQLRRLSLDADQLGSGNRPAPLATDGACRSEEVEDRAERGVRGCIAPGDAAEVGRALWMEVNELPERVPDHTTLVPEPQGARLDHAEDGDDLAFVGGEQGVVAVASGDRRRVSGCTQRGECIRRLGDR